MNTRTFAWTIPVVAAAGLLLSGCGSTEPEAKDQGPKTQQVIYSTDGCHGPAWIRERMPDGVCGTPSTGEVVDDLNGRLPKGPIDQE
ncbi:hypothetical protein ACDF64_04350 [Agromyces sp. MMS24-JH15]|uniref:hypothetical protein n=1 Tax=Agromyces sp. MMS24-JH15 TaxID=3243765 RepID=UPI0037487DDF